MKLRFITHRFIMSRQERLGPLYGLPCLGLILCLVTGNGLADELSVFDGPSLHKALREANPGDDIVLYPGQYLGVKTESPEGRWHYYYSHRSGTERAPITLRSYSSDDMQELSGSSISKSGYILYLTGNHWVVKDLIFHTGQKGIMLDSASHNVLDNIAVSNIRDEGIHFRQSSTNNVLSNCYIYNTGRVKPGFGEAVYVGSHQGDLKKDHSNQNRIGGCRFGPGVTAEAVDIKEGTIGTIVENNIMESDGLSGVNFADSFIDVKGDDVVIRHNSMDWKENPNMDHGIHVLRRSHERSIVYSNSVILGDGMAFLKVGQGTVQSKDNQLDFRGALFSTYGTGNVSTTLPEDLPALYDYTGYQSDTDIAPASRACQSIPKGKKMEIDVSLFECVDMPVELSGRLVQVWDSNKNTSCNFRGDIVSANTQKRWSITKNYKGTRSLNGSRFQIAPSNGCNYLIIRWL